MSNRKQLINNLKKPNKSSPHPSSTGQKISHLALQCSKKHVNSFFNKVKMYKLIPNYDKCLLTLEKLIECNNGLNKGSEYFLNLFQYMGSGEKLWGDSWHKTETLPKHNNKIINRYRKQCIHFVQNVRIHW